MYLSKFILDFSRPSVRQALRNCQDMHRNIMSGFHNTREDSQVLYRLKEKKNETELYVLSGEKPDWESIIKNGFILQGMRDISLLEEYYKEDSYFKFELLVYPSKKIAGTGKNSRRIFLKTEEERKEWMIKQGEKYGFEILEMMEDVEIKQIYGMKDKSNIRYTAVNMYGCLKITDSRTFWKSYQKGIGAGKAYGLGMLLISRM